MRLKVCPRRAPRGHVAALALQRVPVRERLAAEVGGCPGDAVRAVQLQAEVSEVHAHAHEPGGQGAALGARFSGKHRGLARLWAGGACRRCCRCLRRDGGQLLRGQDDGLRRCELSLHRCQLLLQLHDLLLEEVHGER